MSKIYAIINPNKGDSITYLVEESDKIYNSMMQVTGNDHEIASDASSWCELASVGEVYEFREGTITISDKIPQM